MSDYTNLTNEGISEGVNLNVNDLYNLYIGNPAVLNSEGREYLRYSGPGPETTELSAEFNWRKTWTPYLNLQRKIISTYLSYMYVNTPNVEIIGGGDDPDGLIKSDTINFARRATKHAFIAGACYAYTDTEPHLYTAKDVDASKAKEGIYIIHSGSKSQVTINTDKMIRTGLNAETSKEETHPLKPGQFEIITWDDIPLSLIADTAPLNVQIYNLMSVLDSHAIRSLIYWLFGPATTNKLAAYEYVGLHDPKVNVTILKPGTEDIEKLAAIIKGLILQMGVMVGLEEEFGGEILAGDSALAVETRMLDTNALLTTAAFHISRSVNRVMAYYASIGGDAGLISIQPRLKVLAKKEVLENISKLLDFGIAKGTVAWAKLVQLGASTALSQELTPADMQEVLNSIEVEQVSEMPFMSDMTGDPDHNEGDEQNAEPDDEGRDPSNAAENKKP